MGYTNKQQTYAQSVGITPTNYPWIDTRDPTVNDVLYPIGQFWLNQPSARLWYLDTLNNQVTASNPNGFVQATWALISDGAVGPLVKLGVPLGTSPIAPDTNGLINFTSSGGTIAITGSAGGLGAQDINFDITGGLVAIEEINIDAHTNPGTNPVVPASGAITVTGGQVAAGTNAHVIQTNSLAANTYTIQIQRSQAVASSTVGDNGISHFNSAQFTVDSNGFVTITNFTPFAYTTVNHAASPYTVLTTDYYISCDPTAGIITIDLPNAPIQYREFVIKDRTGQASTNNITVTTVGGSVTIDGQTIYRMTSNYSAINLLFNGTSYEVY